MRIHNVLALVAFCFLFFSVVLAAPAPARRVIDVDDLVRIRCSHNPDEETYFFFNGSVYAYTPDGNKLLFNGVGLNVGRCFKQASGAWTLASREAMYYINPATDQIIDSWTNFNGETVTVAHVDNDPVIQNWPAATAYSVLIGGEDTTLPIDTTTYLFYPNPLYGDPRFVDYSPQRMYQAAELFKFIAPTDEVFSDLDTVSRSNVAWTREGPWLPWMKHGNRTGFLLYSFSGFKIPDWTYLPEQVKADIATRVPHYKHAPECIPNTTSVTSWTFFKNHFDDYLAKEKFPLAERAQYGCANVTLASQPSCKAAASAVLVQAWRSGSATTFKYRVQIENQGSQTITSLSIAIDYADVRNVYNLNQIGNSNVYTLTMWNRILPGVTLIDAGYSFDAHGQRPAVYVASVTCL